MRTLLATLFAIAAGASCGVFASVARAAEPAAPAAEPAAEAVPEDEEPFILMINAGRAAILADRAFDGVLMGEAPPYDEKAFDELRTAKENLAGAVLGIYRARAVACERKTVAEEHCGPLPPPDWLGEPVAAKVSAAELKARLDWVWEKSGPFVEAGCKIGREASKDELFCSVE